MKSNVLPALKQMDTKKLGKRISDNQSNPDHLSMIKSIP